VTTITKPVQIVMMITKSLQFVVCNDDHKKALLGRRRLLFAAIDLLLRAIHPRVG